MPNTQTTDSRSLVRTQPTTDANSLIAAKLRDLTPLGGFLSGKGWVRSPTATHMEPFIAEVGIQQYVAVTFSRDGMIAFALTSIVSTSAHQITGDEMLSSAPTTDVQPGMRVELMDEPIGVTLSSLTGEVVGPSRWEGFVVVRLDKPGVYHNADGTDEPIEEIVEAPDNLTVLSRKK